MKRKRLGEEADRLRIKALLKENNPGWKQTRLTALKMVLFEGNIIGIYRRKYWCEYRNVER